MYVTRMYRPSGLSEIESYIQRKAPIESLMPLRLAKYGVPLRARVVLEEIGVVRIAQQVGEGARRRLFRTGEPHERAGPQVEFGRVQPGQGERLPVVDAQFEAVHEGDHEPGQAGEVVRARGDRKHPPHAASGVDHEVEVEYGSVERARGCRNVAGEDRRLVADPDDPRRHPDQ